MPKKPSQSKEVDVFEMILESMNNPVATSRATATRREQEIDLWETHEDDGQLAVDVAETDDKVIAVSTMAGARPDKIEVFVHNDLLTIRGERRSPLYHKKDIKVVHHECFWGKFSRTVVLPVDVKGDEAEAEYKHGVLSITIPKQIKDNKVQITVVEE